MQVLDDQVAAAFGDKDAGAVSRMYRVDEGKCVCVRREQADGTSLIQVDTSNSSQAPTPGG